MQYSLFDTPEETVTRVFETGATRDTDTNKLDYEGFLAPRVLRRYAEYMHEARLRNVPEGQVMRSADNWQKGMPFEVYLKSLIRHVMEVWELRRSGEWVHEPKKFEDALCAVLFNTQGMLFELGREVDF